MSKFLMCVCYCFCSLPVATLAEEKLDYHSVKEHPMRGEAFHKLIKDIGGKRKGSWKLMLLNKALIIEKDQKEVYLKHLIPVINQLSLEEKGGFKAFKDSISKLDGLDTPLRDDECKLFVLQLKLSSKDRLLFAKHCWDRKMKSLAFDVAFNEEDLKRFGPYTNELRQVVLKMKKNPFAYGEERFWLALTERNLWPAFANFLMSTDVQMEMRRYTGMPSLIVGMMTLFGENEMRSWVTDWDKRKNWLESPLITAGYFYQQGMVKEAFAYLEDANLTDSSKYHVLCYNSGRFDKLIELYQKRIKRGSKAAKLENFGMAYAAQQVGDEAVYEKHLKLLKEDDLGIAEKRDDKDTVINLQRRHIQMFLALSEMQIAIEFADRYGLAEDVFRLLCMSYKFETAHQYIQVGKVINPEKFRVAELAAKRFFSGINHAYAKQYDPDWKPKKWNKGYQDPVVAIKKALEKKTRISKWALKELEMLAENVELEKQIVAHFLNGHFSGSVAERELLEKYGKLDFMIQYFSKKYKRYCYSPHLFFLVGHYTAKAGRKAEGERKMLAASVMALSNDSASQALVDTILEVDPEYPTLEALRKSSRRALLSSPSGRQCFYEAYKAKAYEAAANTWRSQHFSIFEGRGYSGYGRHIWAWQNNAHPHKALAQLALENGDLEKSHEHLLKMWKVAEVMSQQGYNLYSAYLKKGETEKAQQIFDRRWSKIENIYLQTQNHPWALTELVVWSLACRKPLDGKALALAQKLHQMKGDRYYQARLLAEHYVLSQQPDKAREVLKPWLERRARDKELLEFSKTLKLPEPTLKETWNLAGVFKRLR